MEEKLNKLLRELITLRDTGAEAEIYAQRLHEKASQIYEVIKEALNDGYEVWAHKDNGLILKIGVVGPLKRTSFDYGRYPHVQELRERCQLLVISRFELRKK